MERSPRAGLELSARAVRELVDRVHLGQDRAIVRHDAGALVLGLHLLADHPGDLLSSIRVQSEDRSPGRGRPGRHEPDAPAGDLQGAVGDSQLLVITHQKRTMEIADALYGVTMRDGITTVVSQRLAE